MMTSYNRKCDNLFPFNLSKHVFLGHYKKSSNWRSKIEQGRIPHISSQDETMNPFSKNSYSKNIRLTILSFPQPLYIN